LHCSQLSASAGTSDKRVWDDGRMHGAAGRRRRGDWPMTIEPFLALACYPPQLPSSRPFAALRLPTAPTATLPPCYKARVTAPSSPRPFYKQHRLVGGCLMPVQCYSHTRRQDLCPTALCFTQQMLTLCVSLRERHSRPRIVPRTKTRYHNQH
jgi:hypothetical protein